MRAQVVQHYVDLHTLGDLTVQCPQERQELLMPVALVELRENLAIEDVERGVELDCPVPPIVMRSPLGPVPSHR